MMLQTLKEEVKTSDSADTNSLIQSRLRVQCYLNRLESLPLKNTFAMICSGIRQYNKNNLMSVLDKD